MCRWLAYSGSPVFLDDLLFNTEYSLIQQSLAARRSESTTNGDGFGIAWYEHKDTPGLYRAIRPAWNDENLRDLAAQLRCSRFLAHVRATTGSAIQRSNCHPFRHRNWTFVHNGLIQHYPQVRRDLLLQVRPELFNEIRGTTDSEVMFFLALGLGMDKDPLGALERMTGLVESVAQEHAIANPVQMTVGLCDGENLYAVRYSSAGKSRTLYHSKSIDALRELTPSVAGFSADTVAVVSEPFTHMDDYWVEIPEASALSIVAGQVSLRPFQPAHPSSEVRPASYKAYSW